MREGVLGYLAQGHIVKMSGGKKLANTEIVRAAVRFLLESGVDVSGCRSEGDMLVALRGSIEKSS